jgi:type IV pilus assembly protein PilC
MNDITIFTRQMATTTIAGLPLLEAFDLVIDNTSKPKIKKTYIKIKRNIENGSSLSKALIKHPKYFDNLYCSLIEAGEQTGSLDQTLSQIANFREKLTTTKRKIIKSLVYPLAVIITTLLVTLILLIKIIPTFESLFLSLNADLPFFTYMIIKLSNILKAYFFYIVLIVVSLLLSTLYLYKNNNKFQTNIQTILLKVPFLSLIFKKFVIIRFSRTLATTFAAGVPLQDGLESIAKFSSFNIYNKAFIDIKNHILSGEQIYKAIDKTECFPSLVTKMIKIGEETGKIDDMLQRVAKIYEEEVDLLVDNLSTLIEPVVMVVLGLVVGSLVIAMYLPIFKLGTIL